MTENDMNEIIRETASIFLGAATECLGMLGFMGVTDDVVEELMDMLKKSRSDKTIRDITFGMASCAVFFVNGMLHAGEERERGKMQ